MGKSKLRQAITNGDINIPEAAALPGSASKLPFVIVADDAFPLMPNIMKPYPGSNLNQGRPTFLVRIPLSDNESLYVPLHTYTTNKKM
ncbi:hypothetical protein TNCV_2501631 [Trichonephila clavipes]|nr:hypothetical protein TNCV_2501631 [Trichonephila clavipes]